MTSRHTLLLPNQGTGTCDCGGFEATGTPNQVVKAWQQHVEAFELLTQVRDTVALERAARSESEDMIRRLLELGLRSREISAVIGTDELGKPFMSPTTIQRLGRQEHKQTPRRRRRS